MAVVGVRALCEFTARSGDLDLRFTPTPSGRDGQLGHQWITDRRPAGYQREISVTGEYGDLTVRGRVDGFDPGHQRLEEIKTCRGDPSRLPDNHRQLHWAQARVYGWLLCQQRGLAEIELALVYLDLDSQRETTLREQWSATALRDCFTELCGRYIHWAHREEEHRRARDRWLGALTFPFPEYRTGQRQLAECTYKAAATGRCLMIQAPTGIGKTLGTLFPLLKAMPTRELHRVFFLTARTPGRRLALQALTQLGAGPGRPLRALELVARSTACEYPDRACHGDSCPLARGFHDRLPAARAAAVDHALLDRHCVRDIALRHEVCPYYLGQDLAQWSDVTVGDYNHYFDQDGLLYALAQLRSWRIALLVDEAHNLVPRARDLYSAGLDQRDLGALTRDAPTTELRRALGGLGRCWSAINRKSLGEHPQDSYRAEEVLPPRLLDALRRFNTAASDFFEHNAYGSQPQLSDFFLEASKFRRLGDSFGEHSLFDLQRLPAGPGRGGRTRLSLRNVVPATFLEPRFQRAHCAVLFSATLAPPNYFVDLLGLPEDNRWLDVESPFGRTQLEVLVEGGVSTRLPDRAASLEPITARIAAQFARKPGNYLAFFSSFDYLEQAADRLRERFPEVPAWSQTRAMGESAREAFLERFTSHGRGVGFAVLGGAFGEGIDLPGTRLIGAFIATLGLPQFNPVNEEMRRRMQVLFGRGYEYTYLYPGLCKVIQAAGRVVRSESDRGRVILFDDRFATTRIQRLLPGWWQTRADSALRRPD